ncbi:hypothetical protein [Dinoroseobacter sp. S375]|uniref:hypothetical protein n=1 Tax=Dinoroseobacter sp. S375 TaxID=3415136 RepID=UPI003C79C759
MRSLLLTVLCAVAFATVAHADRASFVDLAKRGWNYELRTTMVGRDMSIPVHINGRDLAGASLCLVGERPHPASLEIINAFRDLAHHVFGKPLTMRYAGRSATACGAGRTVVLRLYSGYPPNGDLSNDLGWLNQTYQLGLPKRRAYAVSSPAMAQTFFGRRGLGTHIMVKQPALERVGALEALFYKSILIEELFQSFSFGMDIILFDRAAEFQSKLQELPTNLHRLNWESRAFMRALLNSNPPGLCAFDVFMLHAVAQAPVDQTVDPAFIEYIDLEYDRLLIEAQHTMQDPRFAAIISPGCQRPEI